jgi:hypothetical protein
VKAKSSGDGVRDLGDVLGGKGDKGGVRTSVGRPWNFLLAA